MIRYAMSFVSANVIKLDDRIIREFKPETNKPWLVSFCREVDEGDCLDDDQVYKLAVMLVRRTARLGNEPVAALLCA